LVAEKASLGSSEDSSDGENGLAGDGSTAFHHTVPHAFCRPNPSFGFSSGSASEQSIVCTTNADTRTITAPNHINDFSTDA
jgi:hypothetical protein